MACEYSPAQPPAPNHRWADWELLTVVETHQRMEKFYAGGLFKETQSVILTDTSSSVRSIRVCRACGARETK